jgi:predicted O-methyltransferase YrrM
MHDVSTNPDLYQKSVTQKVSLLFEGLNVFPLLASLRKLEGASPEHLVDFALGHGTIRPLQDRIEFLEFSHLLAAQSLNAVLEIGTFRGGTLFVIARLSQPDATLVSLDLPNSRFGALVRKFQQPLFKNFTRGRQRLFLLRGDSHTEHLRSRVEKVLSGELDLLFIDGDHSYEGVKADFEMYSPFVRQGGMVAFHDIAHAREDYGVKRFWNEIKGGYNHREFINPNAVEALGIGVLWK